MKVLLKDGRVWMFEWDGKYWKYSTRKNTYFLMCDYNNLGLDIWIGRLSPNKETIYTCEKRLGVDSIFFLRGEIVFH